MRIEDSLHQCKKGLAWIAYALICVWLALALVWWLFSRVDYGYPLWYSVLAIDEHIATYAPQNPKRPGFAELDAQAHAEAFRAIRKAVHAHGEGLAQITYAGPHGQTLPLLIETEVAHLQDVAVLLSRAALASLILVLVWLPAAWATRRLTLPSWRSRGASAALLATPLLLWLLIAGPKAVFYQFHIWFFPPENPWFFYWEESLMSTLMKAPYLFGAIAVVLVIGTALLTPVFYRVGRALAARIPQRHPNEV
ncbi:DUF1461 domain-containing protein [Isoalcanivorax indicus]|uniref:lipoprotein intramolecular transacylase Lit n=1 Tax=Isoalcanivorax indicus TaxID=2202653 RepID=UPI000DB97DA1|nr:DUF1461 domain-containing protein [Isoalcanivorax indicus]